MDFKSKNFIILVSFIFFSILVRVSPQFPNFSPIMASCIFIGFYTRSIFYPLVYFMVTMLTTDYLIGFYDAKGMFANYFSMFIGVIGAKYISSTKIFPKMLIISAFSAIIYFLLSNFFVWLLGNMYVKNLSGIYDAYIYAIPFFKNTILSNLYYIVIFYLVYLYVLDEKAVINSNKKVNSGKI